MRRSRSNGLILTLTLALVVVAFAASGSEVAGASAPAGATAAAHRQAGTTVTINTGDNFFKPQNLEIAPGTTVKWVNKGRNLHNVVPDKGKLFGTSSLPAGKSYKFTFQDPGKYPYYCSFHGSAGSGMFGTITVTGTPTGDGGTTTTTPTGSTPSGQPRTIKVPADSPTIQGAVDQANPGDLVLVSPGTYNEAVTVNRPNIVIRGIDRNTTILEGGFERPNGFTVTAPGVAIENLTARDYQGNGIFWTGVKGYRASYVTAYRNGQYGLYSDQSTDGRFDNSYASGSGDAGFYIGECAECNAVVTNVVAEYNQLGFSATNASRFFVVNSVWRLNRAGLVPNSDDGVAPSQSNAVIAANRVYDNQSEKAARTSNATYDEVFGVGIGLVAGTDDVVSKNLVLNQSRAGIVIAPDPSLPVTPSGNKITDNVVRGSGVVDLAIILTPASAGNCFSGNTYKKSSPADIEKAAPCQGTGTGDFTTGAVDVAPFLDSSKNPPGTPYQNTPLPKKQPNMRNPRTAKAVPATSDKVPGPLPDLTALKAPKKK